jgi:hypothetical protein
MGAALHQSGEASHRAVAVGNALAMFSRQGWPHGEGQIEASGRINRMGG